MLSRKCPVTDRGQEYALRGRVENTCEGRGDDWKYRSGNRDYDGCRNPTEGGGSRTLTMLTHTVSPDLESVAGAQGRLLDEVGVLAPETVGLEAALGRILAEPISSRTDLPGFDNSAMDGYAVRAGDVAHASADAPVRLQVVGESRAGAVPSAHVAGTAMRIMTGAPMPDGADTVVRQEDTTRDGGMVLIEVATPLATSVRPRGADIRAGDAVIQPGQQLTSIEIGVVAALGHARLPE